MGISLAPDPNADPTKPKPQTPQAPGQAGGSPPPLALAQPAIPAPTVAAPSAPVDRLQLAQSNFDTSAKASQPAYQASIDAATRAAAGAGQIGSGQLRTTYGDLSLARQRDLDTLRSDLVNKATEGSIADAQTAYGQSLSAAQQAEAQRLGEGNLTLAGRAQDTSELGVKGNLGIEGAKLDLAKTGQTASIDQQQQQIDLAKKTADINAQYQAGTLSLAQKDQALRELANSQQNTIATGQLDLAKGSLAEQTAARLQQGAQFNASLAQSGEQFKASLAQNAQQFGLSQDQQMALAKLNDATANRSIDVSSEQGKNQLLVQLASILGGPTGALNADALKAIASKFGVTLPDTQTNQTGPTVGSGGQTITDPPGTAGGKGGKKVDGGDGNYYGG